MGAVWAKRVGGGKSGFWGSRPFRKGRGTDRALGGVGVPEGDSCAGWFNRKGLNPAYMGLVGALEDDRGEVVGIYQAAARDELEAETGLGKLNRVEHA